MRLSPSRLPPAKEKVYRELKASILGLQLQPGEPLVESMVAERYGISRTPAREALMRLVDEGLVEVIPRKGYFVSQVTLQDVLESYQLRTILEPEAAALAAQRDTARLSLLLNANMHQHTREATAELNREFHLLIAQASGNRRLARMIGQLLDEVHRVAVLDPYLVTPDEAGHREHWVIIHALAERNPESARDRMREHLESGRSRALEVFSLQDPNRRRA